MIDLEVRARQLLTSYLSYWQRGIALLAALAPLALGVYLTSTPSDLEENIRSDYILIASAVLLVTWIGRRVLEVWPGSRRREVLKRLLERALGGRPPNLGISRYLGLGFGSELRFTYLRGFSLLVLWPEVQTDVKPTEAAEIQRMQWRRITAFYFAVGSAVVAVATFVGWMFEPLSAVLAGTAAIGALAAIAGVIESARNKRFALSLQGDVVLRHSESLVRAYGLPYRTSDDRRSSLQVLSLLLLRTGTGSPGTLIEAEEADLRLARIVDQSVTEAIAPPPVINISGSLALSLVESSPSSASLLFEMTTGEMAYADAKSSSMRKPFRLTGGVNADTCDVRITVDSPGLLSTPHEASGTVHTSRGAYSQEIRLDGPWIEGDAAVAITVYCSNRFVGVCHLTGSDD